MKRGNGQHCSAPPALDDAYDVYRRGEAMAAARRFSWERATRNHEHGTIAGVLAVAAFLVLRAIFG